MRIVNDVAVFSMLFDFIDSLTCVDSPCGDQERIAALNKLSLFVNSSNAFFFEETNEFPKFSRTLQFRIYPDTTPRDQSVSINRCQVLQETMVSMTELTDFELRQERVSGWISVLSTSSLSKLSLDVIEIDQDGVDALSELIPKCTKLKEFVLNPHSGHDAIYLSPIFEAILGNSSIRVFRFKVKGMLLNESDCEHLVKLINYTQTLKELSLTNIHFQTVASFSKVLVALTKNSSIVTFGLHQFPSRELSVSWTKLSENEKLALNESLVGLIRGNKMVRKLQIQVKATPECSIFDSASVVEAVNSQKPPILDHVRISDSDRIWESGLNITRSVRNYKSEYLNHLFASVFKVGRILSGESLVCGQRIPLELIEEIMRQVSVESVWDDALWKPIRRVALNRQTIGLLLVNDEPFDAYELLYLCRSLV